MLILDATSADAPPPATPFAAPSPNSAPLTTPTTPLCSDANSPTKPREPHRLDHQARQLRARCGRKQAILAVGLVTDQGEITLYYVSPDARFRGISRAMLAALEARACKRGNTTCTLTSTETARRFYETGGYVQTGPSTEKSGAGSSYPMVKRLTL